MTETENKQRKVTNDWFGIINDIFGASDEKTSSLNLLKDFQEKKHGEQEEAFSKPKPVDRLLARFRVSKSEFLITQEDAEEVIDCCCCVLEMVYGISFGVPYSIKLKYLSKNDHLIEIENIPGFNAPAEKKEKRKVRTKKKAKENEGTITVLGNAPYISVVIAFLEICFGSAMEKGIENLKAEDNSQDSSDAREHTEDVEQEAGRNKEWEIFASGKGELINRKRHITAWLVANCLYVMGELSYAKQYIEDYQKDGKDREFDEICKLLGIPWNVQREELTETIQAFLEKSHYLEQLDEDDQLGRK